MSDSYSSIRGDNNSSGNAVEGLKFGTGRAGYFAISNANNGSDALQGQSNGSGNAVYGVTSGTGRAGFFAITNANSDSTALEVLTDGPGNAVEAYSNGSGKAGVFHGNIDVYGHVWATSFSAAAKSFVQPHPTDPSKEIVYVAMEGSEHVIFLRGTAQLINGKATIETPDYFRMVAGEEGITVQFTPRSSRSRGLAAIEVNKETILVEELMEGTGSYEFDYFVTAKRAGFESHEPIQRNTHFTADSQTKEGFERRYTKVKDMSVRAMRNLLISNGILTKDGELNKEVVERLGWKLKEAE